MEDKEDSLMRREANRFYLYIEQLLKVWGMYWIDFKLSASYYLSESLGQFLLVFSLFLSWMLGRDELRRNHWPLTFIKGLFLVPVFLFIVVPVFLLILSLGSIGALLGLRNIGEYSFKEQMAAWLLPLFFILFAPIFCREYILYTISVVMAYSVGVVGLEFLLGQCGIISLGQGGFLLTGGYITLWLSNGLFGVQLPVFISLIIGAFLNGIIGILMGAPALRVKDSYLVVVSIALTMAVPEVLRSKYLIKISGASSGGISLPDQKVPAIIAWMPTYVWNYFLIAVPSLLLFFFAYNLIHRSQIGRALRTMRCENEVSMVMGIPLVRYKLMAFTLSAVYAGFSGGFLLMLTKFISPEAYSTQTSISFLTANIIGGTGGLFGSVIGGFFLAMEPSFIHFVSEHIPFGKSLTSMGYGILLILITLFAPLGIAGEMSVWFKSKFRKPVRRGSFQLSPPPDFDYLEVKKQYFPVK